MNSSYLQDYNILHKDYDSFKRFIYNGSELRCIELQDYYIDNVSSNELQVEFLETFHEKPYLFVTINGFIYKPHLTLGGHLSQVLEFNITDIKDSSFRFEIFSKIVDNNDNDSGDSEAFFKIEDFDRIDVCYYAFVRYNKV